MSDVTIAVPTAETKVRVPKAKVVSESGVLTFNFANGDVRTLRMAELTPLMFSRAAEHGIEQKFRDSYAGAASASEAVGLFDKVFDHVFASGAEASWTAGREGGPSEDSLDLLAQAIVIASEAKGKVRDVVAIRAFLDTIDKAGRAKLRADGGVMVALATLKAAKATGSALDSIPD